MSVYQQFDWTLLQLVANFELKTTREEMWAKCKLEVYKSTQYIRVSSELRYVLQAALFLAVVTESEAENKLPKCKLHNLDQKFQTMR